MAHCLPLIAFKSICSLHASCLRILNACILHLTRTTQKSQSIHDESCAIKCTAKKQKAVLHAYTPCVSASCLNVLHSKKQWRSAWEMWEVLHNKEMAGYCQCRETSLHKVSQRLAAKPHTTPSPWLCMLKTLIHTRSSTCYASDEGKLYSYSFIFLSMNKSKREGMYFFNTFFVSTLK